MKIAIIYHSVGGNTEKVAGNVAEGIRSCGDIEVKMMNIEEVDAEFVSGCKAVIFGCPTYYGTFTWQMKKWLDTSKVNMQGKIGSVFITENHLGGGADIAEMGIIGHLLVKGMLVYSGGCAKGAPFTHYGAVAIKDGDEFQQERAKVLGKRVAEKVLELFA